MEEEQKEVIEQPETKKKSKLPIILFILILLVCVGVGTYWITKKTYDKPQTKTEEKNNNTSEEKSNEEDKQIEKGTDTNTSGLEIYDTKIKEFTINGEKYELKIEILSELDEETTIRYFSQNVYFNGYKFIDNKGVYSLIISNPEYYKDEDALKQIDKEYDNAKLINDTNGKDSYLVFDAGTYRYYQPNYVYIINLKGEMVAKLVSGLNGAGMDIQTNTKPETPYAFEEDKITKGKYILYGYSFVQIEDNYILFLPIQNIAKSNYSIYYGQYDNKNDVVIEENKLVITDGKAVVTKSKTYKKSEGYMFEGAGGTINEADLEEFDKDIIEPAK